MSYREDMYNITRRLYKEIASYLNEIISDDDDTDTDTDTIESDSDSKAAGLENTVITNLNGIVRHETWL